MNRVLVIYFGLAQAHRVAAERGEAAGGVIGYSVRLDSRRSARTRVLFCTTGWR